MSIDVVNLAPLWLAIALSAAAGLLAGLAVFFWPRLRSAAWRIRVWWLIRDIHYPHRLESQR